MCTLLFSLILAFSLSLACFLFLIFALALPFSSFLPNFSTCVSSMSKNYILFSFEFLFRWRAMRLEWWKRADRVRMWARIKLQEEKMKSKSNKHFLSQVIANSGNIITPSPPPLLLGLWWVEDESIQNDIIYLLFLDADKMKMNGIVQTKREKKKNTWKHVMSALEHCIAKMYRKMMEKIYFEK